VWLWDADGDAGELGIKNLDEVDSMDKMDRTQKRALQDVVDDFLAASMEASHSCEEIGEVFLTVSKVLSAEKEKNLDGLHEASEKLGVDVASPFLHLVTTIRVTAETLRQWNTSQGQSRGFLEALIVAILSKALRL